MSQGFFITGTDTSVGKSLVSAALLYKLKKQGLSVLGMKPVATGCVDTPDGLRSDDANLLMNYMPDSIDYQLVNPCAYKAPIAPHIAANLEGRPIDLAHICRCYDQLATQAEYMVVEGVGGWKVPLNEKHCVADLAQQLNLPVILVINVRLGCINHAILTYDSILKTDIPLAGWVANIINHDVKYIPQMLESLRAALYGPNIGIIPPMRTVTPENIGDCLNVELLLGQ